MTRRLRVGDLVAIKAPDAFGEMVRSSQVGVVTDVYELKLAATQEWLPDLEYEILVDGELWILNDGDFELLGR